MEGPVLIYGMLLPAALLFVALLAMFLAKKAYNLDQFAMGLYAALLGFVVIAFLLSLKMASGPALSPAETVLAVTSIAMFVVAGLSISYLYIHKILPDFFIRSSMVFTLFSLLALGITFYSKNAGHPEASRQDPERFIESTQYRMQQTKAHVNIAQQPTVATVQ